MIQTWLMFVGLPPHSLTGGSTHWADCCSTVYSSSQTSDKLLLVSLASDNFWNVFLLENIVSDLISPVFGEGFKGQWHIIVVGLTSKQNVHYKEKVL